MNSSLSDLAAAEAAHTLAELSAAAVAIELRLTPLCVAAMMGRGETVDTLLAGGANVNETTTNGMTPLVLAVNQGHTAVVETLLTSGANVNQMTDGVTPIWMAASKGHTDIVNALLANGADVLDTLTVAARENRFTMMTLLYKLLDKDGTQCQWHGGVPIPLYFAAKLNHFEVVNELLRNDADVNQMLTDDGRTALWIAAMKGWEETVDTLLIGGANVDCATNDGITALWIAAKNGYTEVVDTLLKRGANVTYTPYRPPGAVKSRR